MPRSPSPVPASAAANENAWQKSVYSLVRSVFSKDQIETLNIQVKDFINFSTRCDKGQMIAFLERMDLRQLYTFVKFLNSGKVNPAERARVKTMDYESCVHVAENRLKLRMKKENTIFRIQAINYEMKEVYKETVASNPAPNAPHIQRRYR